MFIENFEKALDEHSLKVHEILRRATFTFSYGVEKNLDRHVNADLHTNAHKSLPEVLVNPFP